MADQPGNDLFTADEDCFSEKSMYPDTSLDTQNFVYAHNTHFVDKYILDDVNNQPFLHYYRREIWVISAVIHIVLAIKVTPYLKRIRTLSNQCFWALIVSLVFAMMWSVLNIFNSYTLVQISAWEAYYSPIISLVSFAGTCLFVVNCDDEVSQIYEDGINEDQE